MKQAMNLSIDGNLKEFIMEYTSKHKTSASAVVEAVFQRIYDNAQDEREDGYWLDKFVEELPDVEAIQENELEADPKLRYLKEKYLD